MNTNANPNTAVTLEVDDGLAETIRSSMTLGGFNSVGDFLRSAAEEWHQNHLPQDVDQDSLRQKLEDGLDSGNPVEFKPFMAEIMAGLEAKRANGA